MGAAAVILGLLLAAARPAPAAPPDVVLITLDTVRADRMGFLGSTRGLTPHLDALARESLVFEHAYAQAPLTTVSHATILTGTYPPFHRVQDFGLPLPASVPYVPALLSAAGYRTAAFVGSLILDPKGPIAPGFDRGFEVYDAGFRHRRAGEDPYRTKERRGSEVVARALAWLEHRPPGPLFLWVHLYDAHDPYDPPPAFAARFAGAPYDGEVAAVDAAVGDLLAGLSGRGIFDGALLVVASDHGEGLGDHGESTHGVFLYDATIHVPLLLRRPRAQGGGRRIAARARLADIAPTVLEAAGLAMPATMQGRSLLELAGAAPADERPAYAESEYPRRSFGWSALAAWRTERFLLVQAPRRELYDLRVDPAAARDLSRERPAVADGMAAQMQAALRTWTGGAAAAPAAGPDPALIERLASLGYASGGGGLSASGTDPKDKIEARREPRRGRRTSRARDPALRARGVHGPADLHGAARAGAGPGAPEGVGARAGPAARGGGAHARLRRCPLHPRPRLRIGRTGGGGDGRAGGGARAGSAALSRPSPPGTDPQRRRRSRPGTAAPRAGHRDPSRFHRSARAVGRGLRAAGPERRRRARAGPRGSARALALESVSGERLGGCDAAPPSSRRGL